MKKNFWRSVMIMMVLSIELVSSSPVQAGSLLIDLLSSSPCSGGWQIQASYPPSATCWGLDRRVANTTLIPVPRAYATVPQYPLVGLVTVLGVDWDPSSFAITNNQSDIYRPESEWFSRYRVEIKISALQEDQRFYNAARESNQDFDLQDAFQQVEWGYPETYPQSCSKYSLETVPMIYGGWDGCSSVISQLNPGYGISGNSFYEMTGAQPTWLWLGSQISSKDGSAQRYGERAFGMRVTTQWTVWARSSWADYQRWKCQNEVVIDPITGLPVLDPTTGLPLTHKVCGWKDRGAGASKYVYLGSVLLNYLLVPDEGVQPLYPVPVFQSQPLLTTP